VLEELARSPYDRPATNVVEHPELVGDRILRFANIVGRERVITSTDCSLGGRVTRTLSGPKPTRSSRARNVPAASFAAE
jgi:hypothetical protein